MGWPKPTALKVIEGSLSHHPPPANEPKPKVVLPKCPAHLTPFAKKIWRRDIQKFFRLGLVTEVDGDMFGLRCQWLSEAIRLQKEIEEEGILVDVVCPSKSGPIHYKKNNPKLRMRDKARQEYRAISAMFGESPAPRGRMSVAPRTDDTNLEGLLS